MSEAREGVRLGVDPGRVRVGVAVSDPAAVLATPLVTLPRNGAIEALTRLVAENAVVGVIVGLPRSLSGAAGPAAAEARRFADELATRVAPVPVHSADERFTTMIATRRLSERGVRGGRRRAVVDQAAAVLILQSWLDRFRFDQFRLEQARFDGARDRRERDGT